MSEDGDHSFQMLVLEAVQACDGKLDCVEAYIESRLGKMSAEQREKMRREQQRVLGFREPSGPPFRDN